MDHSLYTQFLLTSQTTKRSLIRYNTYTQWHFRYYIHIHNQWHFIYIYTIQVHGFLTEISTRNAVCHSLYTQWLLTDLRDSGFFFCFLFLRSLWLVCIKWTTTKQSTNEKEKLLFLLPLLPLGMDDNKRCSKKKQDFLFLREASGSQMDDNKQSWNLPLS